MIHPFDEHHLWLALSPHGYGHAAMTAPVVAELRRRRPRMRLTIQTAVPRDFLESRYGDDFELVPDIPDFGLKMNSAVSVDAEASAAAYVDLLRQWPTLVAAEAERLRAARPGLVLANVPPLILAAAAEAGIPAVALSSLNWFDLYRDYCGDRPEAPEVLARLGEAHAAASVFLRCTPAMPMSLPNIQDIGPLAERRPGLGGELRTAIGVDGSTRLGLIAFGGMDYPLDLSRWPGLPGWAWLCGVPAPQERTDLVPWQRTGFPFADLVTSVDVVVSKVGYGTFSEVGVNGIATITVPRPGWSESQPFYAWLTRHARFLEAEPETLLSPALAGLLDALFAQPKPQPAVASGAAEAADVIERLWDGRASACK